MKRAAWRIVRGWRTSAALCLLLALMATGCAQVGQLAPDPKPTATAGDLRLTTDRSAYTLISPIGVTVTNTGKGDLYAVDGRSACAIIQLQRYDSATRIWRSLVGCAQATSPRVNRLVAGAAVPFTLAPTAPSDPNRWESGLYRVAVAYSADQDGASGALIAFSQGFSIS
jgi:hypothetical protein